MIFDRPKCYSIHLLFCEYRLCTKMKPLRRIRSLQLCVRRLKAKIWWQYGAAPESKKYAVWDFSSWIACNMTLPSTRASYVYSQGSSAATSVPTDWDSAIFGYWDGWLDVLIEHRCVFVLAFGPHWEEKGEKLNHMDRADNEETVCVWLSDEQKRTMYNYFVILSL